MRQTITNIEECNPAWLTQVLRSRGHLRRGRVTRVQAEAKTSTTATVAHLAVTYSPQARGDLPRRLFLKISNPAQLPNLPRGFALGDARFYQRILDVADDLPVPKCYDAVVDEAGRRFHLLLEDLSATHAPIRPGPQAEPEKCRQMVQCLADFHAYWWAHPHLERFGGLPAKDEPLRYARSVQETLPAFLEAVSDSLSSDGRQRYERFARDFGPAYASLFRPEHLTLIHGDAHPFNILLRRGGTGTGRIIDWQFHHVSVCTQDVRHTIGLDWPTEQRRALEQELLAHYHRRLLARGVRDYTWQDCWRGYRIGVIDNLFMPMWQWTLQMPRKVWFPTIRRALAAVEDLRCRQLLE